MESIWVIDQIFSGYSSAFGVTWIVISLFFVMMIAILLKVARVQTEIVVAVSMLPIAILAIHNLGNLAPWVNGVLIIFGSLVLFGAILEIIGRN